MADKLHCDDCKKRVGELFCVNPEGGYGRKAFWACIDCLPKYGRPAIREAYADLGLVWNG